jgi:predicted dehydrogenase
MALEYGFNVLIDKPMTLSLDEASIYNESKRNWPCFLPQPYLFRLSHGKTKMVAENQFGNIRKVMVEYPQGWLSTLTEKTETNKQLGELTLKKWYELW